MFEANFDPDGYPKTDKGLTLLRKYGYEGPLQVERKTIYPWQIESYDDISDIRGRR